MGNVLSNGVTGTRSMKIEKIRKRVVAEELANVKAEFESLQEGSILPDVKFKYEVLGPHVPSLFADRLYEIFSSPIKEFENSEQSSPESHVMTFEDFLAFYVCFKDKVDQEMAEVTWQLFKSNAQHNSYWPQEAREREMTSVSQAGKPVKFSDEYISRSDLLYFGSMLHLKPETQEKYARHFYVSAHFDVSVIILKSDFLRVYPQIKFIPLLGWVQDIMKGLKYNFANFDLTSDPPLQQRLTKQLEEKEKNDLVKKSENEEVKLSMEEVNCIQEFVANDIKNKSAKDVMKVFSKMFKDCSNPKLKKYLMNYASAFTGADFTLVAEMVFNLTKSIEKHQKIQFLFKMFSNGKGIMTKNTFKDFIEIFKAQIPNTMLKFGSHIAEKQFLEELISVELDFEALYDVQPMIMAMTAIIPENDEQERAAILAALSNNKLLSGYIHENLSEETEFYVLESKFWEQWSASMNLEGQSKFNIKKEHKDLIENKALIEEMHELRMKDCTYKQDFVLVPKYVFFPLSKWYNCDKTITRQVITYKKSQKDNGGLSNSQIASRVMFNGAQKFYNPVEHEFEGELCKRVGDVCYELEIQPNLFYLGLVGDKGEKPNKQAIMNGRVDYNYIKRVLKADSIPFKEICMSRKTTLQQILALASIQFRKNIKRGRLLIEETVVSGKNLFLTLEEFGLHHGQLIYAEFANSSNEFPTDLLEQDLKNKAKKEKNAKADFVVNKEGKKLYQGTTGGLQNLGNTCYMNSALQVIANIKPLYDYFIKEQLYLKQINIKNPLAFQGALAFGFANLMERMYSGQPMVVPRNFKSIIGRCCEQFQGIDQQDSQEYLSFLIDGLHEELNLRMKKPYIENPQSRGREINELGLENWSNNLQRNWSLIYFLFYGQMRSSIICKKCLTESTTFDIFSNIPLSLPEPSQQTVSILIYRVPNRIKDILNGNIVRDEHGNVSLAGFMQADSENQSDWHRSDSYNRIHSSQSVRDRKNLAKFAESYNYMNNDQPMHIKLRVDNEIKIKDLITKIVQIREVNIDPALQNTEVVVFQLNEFKGVRGLFHYEAKLSNYNTRGQDLYATEFVTRKGRETLSRFYDENKGYLQNHPEALLKILGHSIPSEKGTKIVDPQRPITGHSSTQVDDQVQDKQRGRTANQRTKPQPESDKIERVSLFSWVLNQATLDFEFRNFAALPRDIFIVAYHRRYIKKKHYLFNPYQPQLLANPIILQVPLMPSGRRLYDEIWAAAHVLLKPTSRFHRPSNRWWERKQWTEGVKDPDGAFQPFVLKYVDRSGYSCAVCSWFEKCNGCIIEPTGTPHFEEELFRKVFIAIEWNSKVLEEQYNAICNEVVEHQSTREKSNDLVDAQSITTLDDCLTKFHNTEQLDNNVPCDRCATPQIHLKKLSVFIPPPVLVLQLKRFRLYGNQWRKLQNLVDFPIRNLDLSHFMTDQKFASTTLGIQATYDLHGIVNHYGTLGFGHYISFVRNPFDKKWYRYDDTNREEVPEEKLHKESAYLLFYMRKDIIDADLSAVIPNIEKDFFPGKPVKTKSGGEGFVLERTEAGQRSVSVKLKGQAAASVLQTDEVRPEEDKEAIVYSDHEAEAMQRLAERAKALGGRGDLEGAEDDTDDESGRGPRGRNQQCCGLFASWTTKRRSRATMSFDRQRRNSLQQKSQKTRGMKNEPELSGNRGAPIDSNGTNQMLKNNERQASLTDQQPQVAQKIMKSALPSLTQKGYKKESTKVLDQGQGQRRSAKSHKGREKDPEQEDKLVISQMSNSDDGGLGKDSTTLPNMAFENTLPTGNLNFQQRPRNL